MNLENSDLGPTAKATEPSWEGGSPTADSAKGPGLPVLALGDPIAASPWSLLGRAWTACVCGAGNGEAGLGRVWDRGLQGSARGPLLPVQGHSLLWSP